MRNRLNILALAIVIFAVGCKKDNVTPPPSPEQVAFTDNTTITSTVDGKDIMNFSIKDNQFNVSDNVYKLIDNFGFIYSSYTLSAEPAINEKISLTHSTYTIGDIEPSNETIYEDMKVVDIKNGFTYLWNEEKQTGFILPEVVDFENL